MKSMRMLTIAVVVAGVVLAIGGYLAGSSRSGVTTHTASGYAGENVMTVTDGDWSYAIPAADTSLILWIGADGTVHDRGRADCLPASGQTGTVTFGAVEASVGGAGVRSVVWIDCRH